MFDNFIAVPGNEIIFKFEPGEFGVPSRVEEPGEPGFVKLDLSWLEGNTYVTPTGEKVEDTPLSAIVHELGHALGGYSDNEAYDKGHNIEFVNKIFYPGANRPLFLPEPPPPPDVPSPDQFFGDMLIA